MRQFLIIFEVREEKICLSSQCLFLRLASNKSFKIPSTHIRCPMLSEDIDMLTPTSFMNITQLFWQFSIASYQKIVLNTNKLTFNSARFSETGILAFYPQSSLLNSFKTKFHIDSCNQIMVLHLELSFPYQSRNG